MKEVIEMSAPLVIIQVPDPEKSQNWETEFIVIAVYDGWGKAPPSVANQRIFDSKNQPFPFPSSFSEGTTKTRVVYQYSLEQWHELLESTTLPATAAAIKQIMVPSLLYMQKQFPGMFDDIEHDPNFGPDQYSELVPMS